MTCKKCGCEVPEDESFERYGEILCEDCYLDVMNPAKPCDPWAVRLASRAMEMDGAPTSEKLTDLQNSIMEFINSNSRVTMEEIGKEFGLSESEFRSQVATLMHCDLLNGRLENGVVYFTSTK